MLNRQTVGSNLWHQVRSTPEMPVVKVTPLFPPIPWRRGELEIYFCDTCNSKCTIHAMWTFTECSACHERKEHDRKSEATPRQTVESNDGKVPPAKSSTTEAQKEVRASDPTAERWQRHHESIWWTLDSTLSLFHWKSGWACRKEDLYLHADGSWKLKRVEFETWQAIDALLFPNEGREMEETEPNREEWEHKYTDAMNTHWTHKASDCLLWHWLDSGDPAPWSASLNCNRYEATSWPALKAKLLEKGLISKKKA